MNWDGTESDVDGDSELNAKNKKRILLIILAVFGLLCDVVFLVLWVIKKLPLDEFSLSNFVQFLPILLTMLIPLLYGALLSLNTKISDNLPKTKNILERIIYSLLVISIGVCWMLYFFAKRPDFFNLIFTVGVSVFDLGMISGIYLLSRESIGSEYSNTDGSKYSYDRKRLSTSEFYIQNMISRDRYGEYVSALEVLKEMSQKEDRYVAWQCKALSPYLVGELLFAYNGMLKEHSDEEVENYIKKHCHDIDFEQDTTEPRESIKKTWFEVNDPLEPHPVHEYMLKLLKDTHAYYQKPDPKNMATLIKTLSECDHVANALLGQLIYRVGRFLEANKLGNLDHLAISSNNREDNSPTEFSIGRVDKLLHQKKGASPLSFKNKNITELQSTNGAELQNINGTKKKKKKKKKKKNVNNSSKCNG